MFTVYQYYEEFEYGNSTKDKIETFTSKEEAIKAAEKTATDFFNFRKEFDLYDENTFERREDEFIIDYCDLAGNPETYSFRVEEEP